MKKSIIKVIIFQIIIGGLFLFISTPFQSCEPDEPENENECDTCIRVLKPNIYIYPTERSQLSVNLSFPHGGKIITSIPYYGNGWKIEVDTAGLINNKYEYLFYESEQPDVWQLNEGWIIKRPELETFFTDNMLRYGFYGREIKDFTDYWIPRLVNSEYYEIYPQESGIIETVIKLGISKIPDNTLRLFYVIKGVNSDSNNKINIPVEIIQFNRSGFCITEWGMILK
ncbi:MAG: hypothetical protein Q7J06_13025 [Bacteroidales bacterium]|nr:hypothetical protein [Bacteroidales bacterium]